jgi:hypothetical protein
MGLEGIVSKHKDSRYRYGRSSDWLKLKNPCGECAALANLSFWYGHCPLGCDTGDVPKIARDFFELLSC